MRMPSTPTPWLPLAGSCTLHALVVLTGWLFVQSETRVPLALESCVAETSNPLTLSVIFGSTGDTSPRPRPISTKVVEAPPPSDAAKLVEAPEFNPVPEYIQLPSEPTVPAPSSSGVAAVVGTQSTPGNPAVPGGTGPGSEGNGSGGTTFFQIGSPGRSVVFVLDRSLSMGLHGAFERARAELLNSLHHLPANVQVQVLAYNHQEPHFLLTPEQLLPADIPVINLFAQAIADLMPNGSTHHVNALRRALLLKPDVIYFVTDADDLNLGDVAAIIEANKSGTTIHVIEMTNRRAPEPNVALMALANNNRGTYRCVNPTETLAASPELHRE
jgi:hypothetical protein